MAEPGSLCHTHCPADALLLASLFECGGAVVLEAMSGDPVLCNAMGAAARHRVETEYSWDSKIDRMLEIYAEATEMLPRGR